MSAREQVRVAAVRLRGHVFTAQSHKEAVHVASLRLRLKPATVWRLLGKRGEGFVTTTGRFVSRREAWRIALAAGQVCSRRLARGGEGELVSEECHGMRIR